MKRFRKSAIALVLALLMALQGTEPIFVQAKEAIEDVQKNADFSRPEALTEEEAGITDSTSGEQDKSQQSDADVQNETTPSEDTETQEEQTTPAEETEENPQEKEVELKEPQDYYPIPEEPEGELIDYDAISKTYKTGDKQYTTVYGGYVGTYKNEDGDTELVDNTLVKPEEADTPASEEAQEASSVVATEEKEEKTEVYQNKANDYAILLPEQMSEENGVTIENGKTRIGIIPVDGDYTHSVIKDNAILYNEVYEGADVQYTVLNTIIKSDIRIIVVTNLTGRTSLFHTDHVKGTLLNLYWCRIDPDRILTFFCRKPIPIWFYGQDCFSIFFPKFQCDQETDFPGSIFH